MNIKTLGKIDRNILHLNLFKFVMPVRKAILSRFFWNKIFNPRANSYSSNSTERIRFSSSRKNGSFFNKLIANSLPAARRIMVGNTVFVVIPWSVLIRRFTGAIPFARRFSKYLFYQHLVRQHHTDLLYIFWKVDRNRFSNRVIFQEQPPVIS